MNGTTLLPNGGVSFTAVTDVNWRIEGVSDLNGDDHPDLIWRNLATGEDIIWQMNGTTLLPNGGVSFRQVADVHWQMAASFAVYGAPSDVHLGGSSTSSAFDLGTLNGQATYQSTLNSSGYDYYRFALPTANPNVYARVTASHLDLLSSSGSVLQSAATGGLARLQSALASGTYYLRVSGALGYTLVVADTSAPPSVTTSLVNDTARSGTNTDQRTADPTVSVQVGSEHWLGSLSAGFNTTAPANFLALEAQLGSRFTLTPTQLQQINGGVALMDGSYVLHLRATGVDDVTALTTDLTFTLDTMTSAPSGLHLTTGTGNTTNVTTPIVTGQAEVGALVKVYGAGNVLLGQGVADSTGIWQTPLTALADGTYNVTAISTDVAGNVSAASMVLTLVLDRQAPLAPTLLPLAAADDTGEDGITARTTPTLTGQAEAGTAITLFNNGVAIGQTHTNASGVWQLTTTTLPQGLISLSAIATDAAGNVSPVSAPLVLTIDSVAPAAPGGLRLTTGSDSGQSHTDGHTNVTTPIVEGNATPGVRVQLWGNGQLWGQQKADSSGHWQITSSPLPDDHYLLSAFALDVAGNRSAASLPLDVFVETQAPTAPTTLHLSATTDTGTSQSDGVTANPTPTVVGQAAANALVQLLQQNQVIAQTIADGTGAWQITIPTLTEGAHNLTATATDVAGNVSAASVPLSLVIDTQAPSSPTNVQLASPTAGTSTAGALTKVPMPLFTGNATAGTFITLFSNGVAIGQTAVGTDGTWQVQAQTLTDGAHVLTAKAKDLAGNESLATAPLTVTIDATAPVLVLDTNTAVVLTQQARLSGYVDDLGSGAVSAQYAFDGLAPVALTLSAYGDFDQAFDWTGVSDGTHTLTLTTTDLAGNVLTQTAAVMVNQGLTAPTLTAALAHDTGWDNTDGVTADPQVTGKLAGGNTSAQLRVGLDGATAASFTTVALASDGTFTLDQALINTLAGSTLAIGSTLYFTAYDATNGYGLWKSDGTTAGTTLIQALNPNGGDASNFYLTVAGSTLYFVSDDGLHGSELWKSDGTTAGTTLVKDINPGSTTSNPAYLTAIGSTLYFQAYDPTNGYELWKTDGTTAGTTLVKDIDSGIYGSFPSYLTAVGTTLYFTAYGDTGGYELWKSDGTAAGTVMVKDINSSGDASPDYLTAVGNTLYFSATDGTNGYELWKSDGTAAGTVMVKDINASGDANPTNLTAIGNTLYFSATDGTNGYELWKSDGTTTGTTLVKDINAGAGDSNPFYLSAAGSMLYFEASNGTNGYELWKSDGTTAGTVMVKDINAGSSNAYPSYLTKIGSTVYFTANNGTNGYELWKSDGTATGTVMVKDINPGTGDSLPSSLLAIGSTLYFAADDGTNGYELWKSDGTATGTTLVKDINTQPNDAHPSNLTAVGNTLYFTANDGVHGNELWKSDSTTGGTAIVKDINPTSDANPTDLVAIGNTLYFTADDGTNGYELWKSDGTATGTSLVKDINPGSGGSNLSGLTVVGNTLYFSATDGTNGYELWKSDGTASGTARVKDINSGAGDANPTNLTLVGSTLYFTATDGTNGYELWKSDGTTAGTTIVKDINSGTGDSRPYELKASGNTLFFSAYTPSNGRELWKSDGTAAGTVIVQDINSGATDSSPSNLIMIGNVLYFTAGDGTNGYELWKSDGTVAGTVMVKDINSGVGNANPSNLMTVGNALYFTATNSTNGYELWKSNGTAAGTVMVKDINAGAGDANPSNLMTVGNALYFTATNSTNGYELWKSDGTATGTSLVKDLNTGVGDANPSNLTAVGSALYFVADDGINGYKLWIV